MIKPTKTMPPDRVLTYAFSSNGLQRAALAFVQDQTPIPPLGQSQRFKDGNRMVADRHAVPDDLKERIRLIERAIEKRCKSLQVKTQEQHIQISGAAGRLTKEEKAALRELGIPHSTYGARLYKEHDEYRNYVKHLIERRLITFPE